MECNGSILSSDKNKIKLKIYIYNLVVGIGNCIGSIESDVPLEEGFLLKTPSGKYRVNKIHLITNEERGSSSLNNPQEYHKVIRKEAHLEKF